MPSAFDVVTLKNGLKALRHRDHGEVMHPGVGPWEEANALYVRQTGLAARLTEEGRATVRVLDVGLGGAANAVAALTCAAALPNPRPLEIVSMELDLDPLRLALADPMGFPFLVPWRQACQSLLDTGRWEQGAVRWSVLRGDASLRLREVPAPVDVVFLDPFSPEFNPQLWTVSFLRRIRELCSDRSVMATYSAATPTRVSLLLAGFFVGVGAPTGFKAETTLAATRCDLLEAPLGDRWLERWSRSTARAPHGEPLSPEVEAALRAHPQWQAEPGLG